MTPFFFFEVSGWESEMNLLKHCISNYHYDITLLSREKGEESERFMGRNPNKLDVYLIIYIYSPGLVRLNI